tara:strand:+ start:1427 stop:1798 length:372 start_codon:yes stop_codon:yes gene_type:complete
MRDHRQFVVATLFEISPDAQFTVGDDYESLRWHNQDIEKPTKEEFEARLELIKKEEPMRLLRLERNRRLAETDWIIVKGLEQSVDLTEWKTYRQALRDLPATQEPQLDDVGNLTNVTWPEVPE